MKLSLLIRHARASTHEEMMKEFGHVENQVAALHAALHDFEERPTDRHAAQKAQRLANDLFNAAGYLERFLSDMERRLK